MTGLPAPTRRALLARARRGDLEAQEALQLLEEALRRLSPQQQQRWLPPLLGAAVQADQRRQALVAGARRLRDQQAHGLAYALLQQLPWPQPSPELYLLKGVLERHGGDHPQALISLATALAHPPHHGLACYELGELHRSLGQFDPATAWFLAALRSAPQHPWIHHALQFTRFSESLLPAVNQAYAHHCEQHPSDAMALHLLATFQLRLGCRHDAIETSRRAVRLHLGPRAQLLAGADQPPTPPDFIIIGVPKGGTSSLLSWLGTHPRLWVHPRKELHFFNGAWEQGSEWYCAQFPRFEASAGILRGEATPNYFHDLRVPARIAALAPQARLILLLRDPLQRAISWIEHLRRHEGLRGSTDALLMEELERLEAAPAQVQGLRPPSPGPQALLGSCYGPALQRWQERCSNPLLILRSEDLFAQPQATLARCADFLNIPANWPTGTLTPENVNPAVAQGLNPGHRQRLQAFLRQWDVGITH